MDSNRVGGRADSFWRSGADDEESVATGRPIGEAQAIFAFDLALCFSSRSCHDAKRDGGAFVAGIKEPCKKLQQFRSLERKALRRHIRLGEI